MGFDEDWVRNIMTCVETSRMAALRNYEQMRWFKPGRRVRQGDSISLYLFVLCIERLSHIISEAIEAGRWKSILLS